MHKITKDMEDSAGRLSWDKMWVAEPDNVLKPELRDVLEIYSKIPSSEVVAHIKNVREKAWEVYKYPCIGMFLFLNLSVVDPNHIFSYSDLISSLKSGQTLLDIGCCFGQDIRKLVHDGAPAENIIGSELRPEFVELGYDLFRDKQTLKTQMITPGDIYDVRNGKGELHALVEKGGVDTIYASMFIHLFDWEGQIEVCSLLINLLKKKPGSRILGMQIGKPDGFARDFPTTWAANGVSMWSHDKNSWETMWEEIGKKTGTVWEMNCRLTMEEEDHKVGWLWFEAIYKGEDTNTSFD